MKPDLVCDGASLSTLLGVGSGRIRGAGNWGEVAEDDGLSEVIVAVVEINRGGGRRGAFISYPREKGTNEEELQRLEGGPNPV